MTAQLESAIHQLVTRCSTQTLIDEVRVGKVWFAVLLAHDELLHREGVLTFDPYELFGRLGPCQVQTT